MQNRVRRALCLLLTLILTLGGLTLPIPVQGASADMAGRVPFRFSVDELSLGDRKGLNGDTLAVFKGGEVLEGESISLAGWVATAEGIQEYRYLLAPAGGGRGEWLPVTEQKIAHRSDLAGSEIPYPSGHATAGFDISVTLPEDTPDGYYDLFLRAIDGMGEACDVLAILGLRYGVPDADDGETRTVNLRRLLREGEAALRGADTVITESAITLPPGGAVRLGQVDLAGVERLSITYTATPEALAVGEGYTPILGLKTSGDHPYNGEGGKYDLTDSVCYAPLTAEGGELTLDLSTLNGYGELWLTGYLADSVEITDVTFTYNGYATSRVAARILFSEDLTSYFSGKNRVSVSGVEDPTLGSVLRIELTEESNDPYTYFAAGEFLREYDINLDADEYKYMTVLYRGQRQHGTASTAFYLCAGGITSPTGDSVKGFQLEHDGKWHYAVVDLSDVDTWTGRINGWRFDIYSAVSQPGDYMEFASVQLFRTEEAARAVAAEDPLAAGKHTLGAPAVIKDMREENTAEGDFTLNPDLCYVVTPPVETETPTETRPPVTEPPETTAPVTLPPAETSPEKPARGCGSALWGSALPVAAALSVTVPLLPPRPSARRRNDTKRSKGETL